MDKGFVYNIRTIKDGVDCIVRKDICTDTLPHIGETISFWCVEEGFHGFKDFKVIDIKHTIFIKQHLTNESVSIYI